jgi:Dockerin type I domain
MKYRARLLVRSLEARAIPAVFTVMNTADSGAGSLRQAIIDANGMAGADSIVFDATAFAGPQTITLGGEMKITDAVTITGPTAKLTINASKTGRIFNIDVVGQTGQPMNISGLALTNGSVSGTNNGGAILNNDESLSLSGVTITNCVTTGSGGAIAVALAAGSLALTDCTLSSNSATTSSTSNGGAIFAGGASVVSVTRTTIANNSAGHYGGGISAAVAGGQLTVTDSTLSGNQAASEAGGIDGHAQAVTIRNSTLSGNSAPGAGGIYTASSTGSLTIQNSTIANNSASTGFGGIEGYSGIVMSIESSVIAKNYSPVAGQQDIYGTVTANFCLIGDATFAKVTGGNNKLNIDPVLNPLGNYGGPTQTQPPAGGSPCIDAGSNPAGLSFDQRGSGFARVLGAAPDIGAVEGPGPIPIASASIPNITNDGATVQTVTVTYYDDNAIDVSSLGTGNITVTGPNGFAATPTFVSVDNPTNGTPRIATYQFTPPGGSWDRYDYGAYTVQLGANQVFDTDSPSANAVPAATLCTFHTAITSVYVVDEAVDENDGNYSAGHLSLREALQVANGNIGSVDTITFDPTVFNIAKSLVLTLGELPITDPVTVSGPAARLTIDANKSSRIFNISVPSQIVGPVSISDMSLTNGKLVGNSGGAISANYQSLSLSLSNVAVTNCTTDDSGGALSVFSKGTMTISDCSFIGNSETSPSVSGGGAIIASGPTLNLSVTRSTFSGNSSNGAGGAIYFGSGTITLTDSTLSGNKAGLSTSGYGDFNTGGGLYLFSSTGTVRNCTISGNSAVDGGGVADYGSFAHLIIQNSTIAFNSAGTSGGGGYGQKGATISLESTIVAKNDAPVGTDVAFDVLTAVPGNNNLIGVVNPSTANLTGSGNLVGTSATPLDPRLAPLAGNSGPTATHALLADSPAIDNGTNIAALPFDQRGSGFPRLVGAAPDIGAFESGGPTPIANGSAPVPVLGAAAQTIVVTYSDDVAIDVSSIGAGDLSVSGPNGFTAVPTLVSVDSNVNGTPRVATYQFTPPGGSWDYTDNGTYVVSINNGEVLDTSSPVANSVPAGMLLSINVAVPRVIVVDSVMDENDGNIGPGELSLREAIGLANATVNTVPDSITFDPTIFATPQTILLTLGEMKVTDAVTITGPPSGLTINANQASRIFNIDVPAKSGQAITLTGMTLINGKPASGNGGGILDNDEAVTLTGVTISNCSTAANGGGVSVDGAAGSLTMLDSRLTGNSTTGSLSRGGAVNVNGASVVSLIRCTVSGNTAGRNGGGFYFASGGTLTITDSTLSANKANAVTSNLGGGALFLNGTKATVLNSTLSGNSGTGGGAIRQTAVSATLTVQNSTIAFNSATTGGGIVRVAGTITLTSTIVAMNVASTGPDIANAVTANFCLIGNTAGAAITGSNNVLNSNPLLGSLANNGGPTQTHALLAGSPAVNKGSNPSSIPFDQRGNNRVVGSAADIGAYEVQAPAKFASVVINNGAAQRSMVTQVKVNFNQHIGISGAAAAAFSLNRVGDNAAVTLAAVVDESGAGTAVTLTFTGGAVNGASLADGRYALHILASGFNAEGFDGNGDGMAQGSPADDYAFDEPASPATLDTAKIFRIYGDVDGDGAVVTSDFIVFRQYFNAFLFAFDFDGDGFVSTSDFAQFRNRFNTSI